ncbi:MAG: MmgE/PrpD family protein [Desulfobacterales bacterium]
MKEKTAAEKLAEFVAELSFTRLTENQVFQLKTFFIDWLGSAFAGRSEPPVNIINHVLKSMGGEPEAVVLPELTRGPCLFAALVNGASSHVKEMDDLHRGAIFHPSASIIPAVFAAAERAHISGEELITAIAAGYEVGIRVAMASGPKHYRYWHTTGTGLRSEPEPAAFYMVKWTSLKVIRRIR